jgi:hypothetical protein
LLHYITQSVRHPRVSRVAVATGTAGFLIIGFDAFGQIEMRDKTHVRFVDTHAKGDGCNHHNAIVIGEAILMPCPNMLFEAGVIRQRRQSLIRQPLRGFIDLFARQAVNNSAIAKMILPDEFEQLVARFVFLDDGITDVGSVEARDKDPRFF